MNGIKKQLHPVSRYWHEICSEQIAHIIIEKGKKTKQK